ncbi:kinesin-like protein KIF20B [Vespula squamosa]|uniref:Kinesin-like protein KIF20B n=1 Tax=Vespula squamosa TaxID=30214 RepID=A0ABD1ZUY0_VESSQ
MISDDDKVKSPIGRSTLEYVPIEESDEMGSIDYDEEDSIPESPCEPTVPTFEVYLKIKPKSKKNPKGMSSNENENYYEILNSTTLLTKFKPSVGRKSSRFPLVISKKANVDHNACKRYYFTKIFQSDVTQAEFFEETMKKRIVDFLTGQNSTIMSYGTSNSGKTYTLHGTPDQPGLIPRSIEHIFSAINCTLVPWYKLYSNNTLMSLDDNERLEESERKAKLLKSPLINNERFTEARKSLENSERSIVGSESKRDECNGESMYAVWLSFAEIYNDNIYDLLDFEEPLRNRPLKLIGDKNGLTYVKGLTTIYVTTPFEACQILVAGQSRMSTSFTTLNPKCSRSHTIFTIGLLKYQKAYAPHETEASTLTFCDLAGSGRSKGLSGLSSERLKEARNINKSLLVLGRCLKTVRKKQRKESTRRSNDHVAGPFRESKLTRMFQRALSGNEHVTFLVNIDTSSELVNEIKSILKVSSIARQITSDLKESKRFTPKEVANRRSSRSNETEICNELKSSSTVHEDNKTVLSPEKIIVETDRHDRDIREESPKNVTIVDDQLENISEECVCAKKRKRDELVSETDEDLVTYKDLQAENLLATRKIRDLEDALNDLQYEKRIVLAENNKYSSELLLLKRELKDFQDLAKSEISKLNVPEDEVNNDVDNLAIKLKNVIDEKKRFLGKSILDLKTFYVEEDAINDELNEINDLRKELSEKTINIRALTIQLESCEKELNETEMACKDAENRNVILLKKIEALESVVRYMECERKDSFTPQPPYYLEEISPIDTDKICLSQYEKNHSSMDGRLSSITEILYFGDGTNESPRDFIVQAHVDVKKCDEDDLTDTKRFVVGTRSSNLVDIVNEKKNILEFSGNDFRSSDASSKNDSGIVIEESVDWKLVSSSNSNDRNISENESNTTLLGKESKQYYEKLSELIENAKIYEKEEGTNQCEFNERLKLTTEETEEEIGETELVTRKSFRPRNFKCQRLEDLSRWLKHRLDLQLAYCKMEHLSKLNELKRDLTTKTIDLNEANQKITKANRDLNKLNDLTNRLNDMTAIVAEYRKDREELYEELHKRSEVQLSLEMKLKYFVSLVEEKEEEITYLRKDVINIFHTNSTNKEKIKELDKEIIDIRERMDSIRKELINSEEMRVEIEKNSIEEIGRLKSKLAMYENRATFLTRTVEDLDDKKDELIRVKTQLLRKEREMSLFKSNRDATIKKYEFLVKQLQDEIDKLKDQSRYESTKVSVGSKESANCPARTRNKFKVSESLKKLTRGGFAKDGNWKSNYLRRKSTEEKSVASTSNFSVSRVSSCHETTNVESVSSENKVYTEKEEDQTSTDRTESDVDSNESISRATTGSSGGTTDDEDYDTDEEDSEVICCRPPRRNRMSGWMRIRRIDARTVLTHCSDIELDGDRSDSA